MYPTIDLQGSSYSDLRATSSGEIMITWQWLLKCLRYCAHAHHWSLRFSNSIRATILCYNLNESSPSYFTPSVFTSFQFLEIIHSERSSLGYIILIQPFLFESFIQWLSNLYCVYVTRTTTIKHRDSLAGGFPRPSNIAAIPLTGRMCHSWGSCMHTGTCCALAYDWVNETWICCVLNSDRTPHGAHYSTGRMNNFT